MFRPPKGSKTSIGGTEEPSNTVLRRRPTPLMGSRAGTAAPSVAVPTPKRVFGADGAVGVGVLAPKPYALPLFDGGGGWCEGPTGA